MGKGLKLGQSGGSSGVKVVSNFDLLSWVSKDMATSYEIVVASGNSSYPQFTYDSANNRYKVIYSDNGSQTGGLAVLPINETLSFKWECGSLFNNTSGNGNYWYFGAMVNKPTSIITSVDTKLYGFGSDASRMSVPPIIKNYVGSTGSIYVVYENNMLYFCKTDGAVITALYIPEDVNYIVFSDNKSDNGATTITTYITELKSKNRGLIYAKT